ncbi:hypothetical protein ACFL2S_12605 [Thermodesulfobacteriota bacterium]
MRKKEGKGNTLDGILNEIWKMLNRGASHYHDPFHWPVLGTTGKDGVRLRCVILREFIMPDRVLVCHTDARAAKVEEISNVAKVSWRFLFHLTPNIPGIIFRSYLKNVIPYY